MQTLRADAYASALFCCPGRDKLSEGKLQSFLPYFLCFTKSRRKKSPQGGGEAAERQKDLIGFVRSFCLCSLIRGSQNLDSPFGKVLILLVGSRHCGELNRGLENLGLSERETVLFFSLVRKEPKVPQRFANLWTPGTIQISARYEIFAKMTGHHHVTGRTGDCKLSGYRR